MSVSTTINIHETLLNRLETAADILDTTKTHVISSLMRHTSRKARHLNKAWSRVRYQQRPAKSEWKRLHISPRVDEYEFFLDMRKVNKMSVSFIIAYAINHYLDELMLLINDDMDNYCYKNYAINQYVIDDVYCWVIYWGIPTKLLTP
jgi:hypothetical protein